MAAPKVIKVTGGIHPDVSWLTLNKEYKVQQFMEPCLCWIRDDEDETIVVIVPSLNDGVTGGHAKYWEVVE